jgi:release factor glutamine methyltransferase
MQVHQLLNRAATTLAKAGVEDSLLEAELLLRHCLDVSRSKLFLLQTQTLLPEQLEQLDTLLTRRCLREPLQQIIGSCEFWSLNFQVSHAVLIPRPETEFLLEHVFAVLAKEQHSPQPPQLVLDLCTGSGVIATVLAKELPQAKVIAADYSWEALLVARRNLLQHGLSERVQLLCADLLTPFCPTTPCFDLIVSNPPYIKSDCIPTLEPEVRDWEPHLALSGGSTGMDSINMICTTAAQHLRPGGWLFLEIGADLGAETEQALRQTGLYEHVKVVQDWSGRPRVAQGRRRTMHPA